MPQIRIREDAALLGVSDDTARRWADSGRLPTTKDAAGRSVVEGTDLALKDQSLGAEKMREGTIEYLKDNAKQLPLVVAARIGRTIGTFRPIRRRGNRGRRTRRQGDTLRRPAKAI